MGDDSIRNEISLWLAENGSAKGLVLKDRDLNVTDFSKLNLKGIRFENCYLDFCHFNKCDLSGAQFIDSSVRSVKFLWSQFFDAEFINCNLDSADFRWTIGLRRARFVDSRVDTAIIDLKTFIEEGPQ